MYIGTKDVSAKWNISERRVRALCQNGQIDGALLRGKTWLIPEDAPKPSDGRESLSVYLTQIRALKEKLDSLRSLTPGEAAALNEEFAVEYTYNSNAIEGNTLTLRETDLVLKGFVIDKKPLKDHLDVFGHKEAFDYVQDLVQEKAPITESIIKQIHSLVLMSSRRDRGIYRNIPVRIAGASIVPSDPIHIRDKMEELLQWYFEESKEDFLAKLALFHIRFESIHPFIDGNGRTGRLIVNLELMKLGYPPIDIKFTDRRAYYNAFDSYEKTGKPQTMTKFFAKYLIQRLRRYVSLLEPQFERNAKTSQADPFQEK